MTTLPVTAARAAAQASAPAPVPARPSFTALLEARMPFAATAPAAPPQGALAALSGIERAQQRLDAVLEAARAGRTFTAAELLGLQAEAYRCAQTVDLASKLVEQGAQSVKHALNTQL